MSQKEEIERELRDYLEKEENMRRSDRLDYLMAIVDKHLLFNSMDYTLKHHEFQNMITMAKSIIGQQTMPVVISEKHVEPQYAPHVALLESFISFLNGNGLLKKLVKIDYTVRITGKKE